MPAGVSRPPETLDGDGRAMQALCSPPGSDSGLAGQHGAVAATSSCWRHRDKSRTRVDFPGELTLLRCPLARRRRATCLTRCAIFRSSSVAVTRSGGPTLPDRLPPCDPAAQRSHYPGKPVLTASLLRSRPGFRRLPPLDREPPMVAVRRKPGSWVSFGTGAMSSGQRRDLGIHGPPPLRNTCE